jgi:AcrR family transcriptional regulator
MGRAKKILDRDLIVEKALVLIGDYGYEQFSTRKLATELKISAMTLYNYFENRDAILSRAIVKGYDLFWSGIPEDLESYGRKAGNPLRVYTLMTDYLVDFGRERPMLYSFLFNSKLSHLQRDPEIYTRYASVFLFVKRYASPGADLDLIHSDLYMFQVLANALVLYAISGRTSMNHESFQRSISRAYELCIQPHEGFFSFPEALPS